jgi:hypothetical protein
LIWITVSTRLLGIICRWRATKTSPTRRELAEPGGATLVQRGGLTFSAATGSEAAMPSDDILAAPIILERF